MKNKIIMKLLLCIMAFCMLITCFVGCKKDEDADTDVDTVSTETGDGIHDANGYLLDSLPDELDYEGTEIRILGWNSEVTEYEVEELNGVPIDEAIFKRNLTIESRLNVKLNFDLSVKGHNAVKADYANHVENSISGGTPYDIVSAHTGSVATCATKGLLYDLGSIEKSYLDFEKPWWNSDVIEQTKVGNTFFFCTGDASTSFAQMIYCVYFNATMVDNLDLTSPYEMVDKNEWTYENMIQMGMNVYEDNNQSNTVDLEDTLPLTGKYFDWPALVNGCGINVVEKDAAGSFVLSGDFKGEKAIDVMKDLVDFVTLDGAFVGDDPDNVRDHYIAGKSLFIIIQNGAAARWSLGATGFEYGCVPMPKYDAEQENYHCAARKPISLFGISLGVKDDRMEMISAVLECYGSEGYRQVTPVIFDQVMKYQSSSGTKMTEMLTLIRDSACFDVGRLYSIKGSPVDQPGYCLRNGTTWENYLNQNVSTLEELLGDLSDTLISVAN